MPNKDGTGPMGNGQGGRGLGTCGKFENSENNNAGRGCGCGCGRGRRGGGRRDCNREEENTSK